MIDKVELNDISGRGWPKRLCKQPFLEALHSDPKKKLKFQNACDHLRQPSRILFLKKWEISKASMKKYSFIQVDVFKRNAEKIRVTIPNMTHHQQFGKVTILSYLFVNSDVLSHTMNWDIKKFYSELQSRVTYLLPFILEIPIWAYISWFISCSRHKPIK